MRTFSSSEIGKDVTVQAGLELSVPVAFKPTRLGSAVAEVSVAVCEGCEPVKVSLVGTGIASQLDISPVRLDFGSVAVGATAEDRISGAQPGHRAGELHGGEHRHRHRGRLPGDERGGAGQPPAQAR